MKNKSRDVKCVIQYGDVLNKEVNQNLFQYAIAQKKLFTTYSVMRMPKVLFRWDFENFIPYFERVAGKHFNEVCQCLRIEPFKIHKIDYQLAIYNEWEPFLLHWDKGGRRMEDRMITFVYYFHSPEKKFSGGELHFPENGSIKVEPTNNTMVFSNPTLSHGVMPVTCVGNKFKNGRFAVTGWIMKEPRFKNKQPKVKK
jgi:Rps23 Pro-64 3,4-dihydroxylase Tpa1-like proline 4-hydroxylase